MASGTARCRLVPEDWSGEERRAVGGGSSQSRGWTESKGSSQRVLEGQVEQESHNLVLRKCSKYLKTSMAPPNENR